MIPIRSCAGCLGDWRWLGITNPKTQSFRQVLKPMSKSEVVVVGAGPAGLTAAWELVNARHGVTVLERDPQHVGGLARTLNYKGFRFDIGAHRFFSKNPDISRWWNARLPGDFVRVKRLTRILYRQRFFHYSISH